MNFGKALETLKSGKAVGLPNWKPDVKIKLYVESRYGRVPWKETFVELLSEEWEER